MASLNIMNVTTDTTSIDLPELLDDVIIHENELTEKAKQYFGYHTAIFHAFERYRCGILENNRLTRIGRHLVFSRLNELHTSFKRVLNYAAENIELLSSKLPVVGPLIIYGLPRSGTTLLHNLLACDPNCRAPLFIDMVGECVPPIARSNVVEQERRLVAIKLAGQQRQKLTSQPDGTAKAHPIFAIEEDYLILRQAGFYLLFTQVTFDNESDPDAWLNDFMNKDFAYDYHETFLQLLNSVDAPASHWLLKAPFHTFYLDTLLRHYPHALLVSVHRRLDEVLPSFYSLLRTMNRNIFDETDSTTQDTLKRQTIQFIDKMIQLIIEFRTRHCHEPDQSQSKTFDITYNDLMRQPIETVRRIYDHYNLCWSEEFEVGMHAWLRENPQGKHGRHTYNVNELGLTSDDIEVRYADYTNMFLRSSTVGTTETVAVAEK